MVYAELAVLNSKGRDKMRKFWESNNGFHERETWTPGCWVSIVKPDEKDFDYLENVLHVPENFLIDIADDDERPRTDMEGEWLLTILRIPLYVPDQKVAYVTVPIGIITNGDVIVSVCYHSPQMLSNFIEHANRKNITVPNKFELILRLTYSSAVWFLKYLKQINLEVDEAEKALRESIRNEDLLRLMNLQKSLVYFNTSIRGNEVLMGKMQKIFSEKDYRNKALIDDVLIELKQAHNQVNIYSDILTGTMDTFASIISNNVNTIMRRMTSVSIVLMVPTLIASFYGMNVDVYIGGVPSAFAFITAASILLSVVAFWVFRKIKWF